MIKANKQIIDIFKNLFEEVGPVVIEEGKKAMDEIAKNTKEQVKEFIERLNTEVAVDYIKVELLNSTKLIALAKENTVDGANEVYVWKKTYKNGMYINLAYGKDQNLLEKDKNKFIILEAEALSADLLNMFEESELIILK
ncbi:hypothetical protein [Prevotella pectinovora]|uniref:hypothetical protein n=1 Tax=Prevotella pectinovora TaxID=1602169 RepID=UPI00307A0627